jgi:hypothetical protein
MTNTQILSWIKTNLGQSIRKAIADTPGCIYTEDWLAAIAMRETGLKIMKLVEAGNTFPNINRLVKGDFSKRPGDPSEMFHGYGYWQIDIGSFPDFIQSNDWQDPYKCCLKAISILDTNKAYLLKKYPGLPLNNPIFEMELTASYNCGLGNEAIAIHKQEDVDARTFDNDYSNAVFEYRTLYKSLP